jgi:hypothetical protein
MPPALLASKANELLAAAGETTRIKTDGYEALAQTADVLGRNQEGGRLNLCAAPIALSEQVSYPIPPLSGFRSGGVKPGLRSFLPLRGSQIMVWRGIWRWTLAGDLAGHS